MRVSFLREAGVVRVADEHGNDDRGGEQVHCDERDPGGDVVWPRDGWNARQRRQRGRGFEKPPTGGAAAPVEDGEEQPADGGAEERHLGEAGERDHLAVHRERDTGAVDSSGDRRDDGGGSETDDHGGASQGPGPGTVGRGSHGQGGDGHRVAPCRFGGAHAPLTASTNATARIDNLRREILSAGSRNDRPGSWSAQQPGIRRVQHERTTEMRKVTAGLFSSIDGVVEAPDQWQPAFDEEMGAALSHMLEEQDAVLLGRVTFTEWAGYWPTSTDEPFASWINSTPKYVASTTLDSVGQWANTTLITGSVPEFVADLKEQAGGTIGTAGSPALVRSLIEQGLLDQLTLMISPVVAGGSRAHLFPDDAAPRSFELVEAQPTSSGALIATYRPIR